MAENHSARNKGTSLNVLTMELRSKSKDRSTITVSRFTLPGAFAITSNDAQDARKPRNNTRKISARVGDFSVNKKKTKPNPSREIWTMTQVSEKPPPIKNAAPSVADEDSLRLAVLNKILVKGLLWR